MLRTEPDQRGIIGLDVPGRRHPRESGALAAVGRRSEQISTAVEDRQATVEDATGDGAQVRGEEVPGELVRTRDVGPVGVVQPEAVGGMGLKLMLLIVQLQGILLIIILAMASKLIVRVIGVP